MRALYTVFICVLLLACGETKEENKKIYLPDSNGNLNNISVVIDNQLWDGNVGENVRDVFAASLTGLPVDEPMFKMRQIPTQVFDGMTTRSRIILKIEKGADNASTTIVNDMFAKPQTIAVVRGKNDGDIIAQLKQNKAKIRELYYERFKSKETATRVNSAISKFIEKDGFDSGYVLWCLKLPNVLNAFPAVPSRWNIPLTLSR